MSDLEANPTEALRAGLEKSLTRRRFLQWEGSATPNAPSGSVTVDPAAAPQAVVRNQKPVQQAQDEAAAAFNTEEAKALP